MARTKLSLPSALITTVTIPIRITDINYGNHAGNDSLVSIIHEARMQWLSKNGMTELNAAGISLIMASLIVEFKNQSFYGDILEVNIYCGETTKISFELYYKITTVRAKENLLIAIAKTDLLGFDYNQNKIIQLPPSLFLLLHH